MAVATTPFAATPGEGSWRPDLDSTPTPLAVTALLVVQDAQHPRLPRTLDALASQHDRPQRLVIIDATPDREIRAALTEGDGVSGADTHRWRAAFPDLSFVTVPPGTPFAEIVDTAVDALPGPGENLVITRRPRDRAKKRQSRARDRHEWLWLLHEDSAPSAGALRALVEVVGRSQRIGIAGCKVVEAQRPGHLVNVGLELTRTGRHIGTHMQGEPDQGQHDDRHDVLSVSSAGMLVRRDIYLSLGGFDPAFDGDGDGLDLCWRTHLLGHQVVVVPAATVQQQIHDPEHSDAAQDEAKQGGAEPRQQVRHGRADADRPSPRSGRTLRRHRQVALARCSLGALPVAAAWVALSCTLRALLMLLLKRPRRALAESAQATAPLGVVRILGARHRFGRRGRTRRRHLEALFIPAGAGLSDGLDALRAALTPEPDPDQPSTERVIATDRRSLGTRVLVNPGLWLTLALTVAAAAQWRPLIGGGALRGSAAGLAGGELLPFSTDSAGIWRLWRDHWSGPGLGELTPEHPFLPVLAGLARGAELLPWVNDATSGAAVVGWLLFLALPLSGLSAYLAGRAATKAPWPRAAAGLVWAGLATLSTATAQGRLGPVVAHIVLPLVLAGICTVARARSGSPSTFATVLAAALMGAFAPALLTLTTVVALGVVLLGRGAARLRGLVVALGPWLLLGPWLVRVREEPRALLGGPGGLTDLRTAEPWQLLLAHPGGSGSTTTWWTAPVLALGLLALLVPATGRARATAGLALTALLGLAAGLAAERVVLTDLDAVARTPWPGPALDLMAAALLALALLVFAGVRPGQPAARRSLRIAGVTGLVAMLAGAAVIVGMTAWERPVESLRAAAAPTPAVAEHLAQGPRSTRMLSLEVAPGGALRYRLDGRERGVPARDLDVPQQTDPLVQQAVQTLLAADSGGARGRLADLGVDFVGVTGPGDRTAVTRGLAGVDGLSPMASGRALSLWRVAPEPSTVPIARLRIAADDRPNHAVTVTGANARTEQRIPPGPQGRVLHVAQAPGWAWEADVTFNGKDLRRLPGAVPTYALPSESGVLRVAPALAYPTWRWGQGMAVLVCVFLAVPFGNARSRRQA